MSEIKLTRHFLLEPAREDASGVTSARMFMWLLGPEGAIAFVLWTGWHLPRVERWIREDLPWREARALLHRFASDLGKHAIPEAEDDPEQVFPCEYLTGGHCHYEGTGLMADRLDRVLIEEGSEAVWKLLELVYRREFQTGPLSEEEISQLLEMEWHPEPERKRA